MTLKGKKWIFRLDSLPEVFVSDKAMASTVSKAIKAGRLRKIGSRLYTRNMTEAPDAIVKRNWHQLLKSYFPDALIADRTALENHPAPDGSVFIVASGKRTVELPGIAFRSRKGSPPLKNDLPFLGGLHISSHARAWLENMRPTRARATEVARTLSKPELERRLDLLLRQSGEAALNRLRDEAREVSQQLDMAEEFHELDELIGTFLGTRNAKLESPIGQARLRGLAYDPDRLDLFKLLFEELRSRGSITRLAENMGDSAKTNLAFFEAYFSNYIEGTEFPLDEAVDIVFKGVIPKERPQDAHDVLETYRVVADYEQLARTPRRFDDFVALLRERHAMVMAMRPDKKPGDFKSVANRAGNTNFVLPNLVMGTLEKGFEVYRGIEPPLHRAMFMMVLVSEVHPFVDGNGRVARIMMNSELVAAGEQKIIIPTIFRNNYLVALKALSQSGKIAPIVQVLDFAQKYTSAIRWGDFNEARTDLLSTHAFLDANEADDQGIRLILPKSVI